MCIRFLLLCLLPVIGFAQQTSRLTGRVDSNTGPVAGARVILVPASPAIEVAELDVRTDSLGHFDLGLVSEGRYLAQFIADGFLPKSVEVLVTAGKGVELDIVLIEVLREEILQEVEVRSGKLESPEPGVYQLAIEKTLRLPANFFDPLRLAAILPGVAVANDQGNAIAIRGYSPNALLWRLEGLDIVNPNHLANAGTLSDRPVAAGGGVSILSSQVLDQSNFQRDALPLSVGNVLSGSLDMRLRNGNKQKNEYTIQTGLIGVDLAAEGPLGKSGRTSFLADARYSTIGLLGAMGVNFGDEQIDFQDLTLHVNTAHKKGGDLSVFGFAGFSQNRFNAKDRDQWLTEKDRYTIDFTGTTFGVGLRDNRPLNKRSALQWGAAFSGQHQDRTASSIAVPYPHVTLEDFESDRLLLSVFGSILNKFSDRFSLESGLNFSYQRHALRAVSLSSLGFSAGLPAVDGTINSALIQPYAGLIWRTGRLEWRGGLRWMYFSWNKTSAIEPRWSVLIRRNRSLWTVGYGRTHQQQQTSTYLQEDNSDLSFTASGQWFAEHHWRLGSGLQLRNTLYHHRLTNVPVSNQLGLISAVNQFDDILPPALASTGIGTNTGWETLLEKRFDAGYYLLASGSLYKATFSKDGDSETLESRFSGRWSSTAAGGKEWQRKRQVLGVHLRFTALGGQRVALIDQALSANEGTTVFDNAAGYPVQLEDYSRLDLRLSWRKNKPGRTRTVSLDIQNLTNRENMAGYYFDTYLQKVQARRQLGIIPVLTWRVDF